MCFAIPLVAHIASEMRAWGDSLNVPIIYIDDAVEKLALYRASDIALVASGTASLELGLAGTPFVVGYRYDWLISSIVMRFLRAPSVVLVNIILDRPIVSEFILSRCTGRNLGEAMQHLLDDAQARAAMCEAFADLREQMKVSPASGVRAAALVSDFIGG